MRGSRLSSAVFGLVFASAGMTGSACSGGCDAIGCSDQVVHIDAGELPTSLLPFVIDACVDDVCQQLPYIVTEQNAPMVPVGLEVPTTGVDEGDVLLVTLAVSSQATGEVLLETSGSATAVRYQVGGDCGPWCTNAYMRLDTASGLLVEPSTID